MKAPFLDFRPFRAWRYDKNRINLADVIAPPYDVISPEEQGALYARSPFNVVRLILGKEANFYENACQCWKEWQRRGILVQDTAPAFYLYEQTFRHPWDSRSLRRLALVGVLKLETSGLVLPHEQTFSGPKRDRFLLLEKTETNLSPVFGLYRNPKKTLSKIFSSCLPKPPLFEARDDQKVLHRGWAIQSEEDQKAIHEALASEKILIADGHHRYETAIEYQRRMREKSPAAPSEAPFDFVMMALVEFQDEGLLVLPTHRVIHSFGPLPKKEFLERLRLHFDFLACEENEIYSELEKRPEKEKVLGGLFGKDGNFLLRLKDLGPARKFLPSGKPRAWYEIEANLLTDLVFGSLWAIPEAERQAQMTYTRSWEEAAQAVQSERAAAAFLLRSMRVDTIRELADTGERMTQKTTYFYPKLASGLFFYRHG